MIAGREPRGQSTLAYALLGALTVVVFGSLFGELAGVHDWFSSSIFGLQGFEYLDLGRFWQALLVIGLIVWVVISTADSAGAEPRAGRQHALALLRAALAIPRSTRSGCRPSGTASRSPTTGGSSSSTSGSRTSSSCSP